MMTSIQQNNDIYFIKYLSGYSGCTIILYRTHDSFFVRKISKDINYNTRLQKQCFKQAHFQGKDINVPEIFSYGIQDDGLFYFDMEFIRGMTVAEYIKHINIKKLQNFIDRLFSVIVQTPTCSTTSAQAIFTEKIRSLERTLPSSSLLAGALQKVNSFDFSRVPPSPCCGDLTLENIMISASGELYLIDFLDSFYESWMIDIAKLLQDLELGWSYRHSRVKDYSLTLRLHLAKEALLKNIASLPNGEASLKTIYYLLLLNTLRIYPYAKTKQDIVLLDSSLEKLLTIINNMEDI